MALKDFVLVTTTSSQGGASRVGGLFILKLLGAFGVSKLRVMSQVVIRCFVAVGEWNRHSKMIVKVLELLRWTSVSTNSAQYLLLPWR